MKKILLLITIITVVFISGCTVQDYKDNREAFMDECKLDAECVAFVIEDADKIIKQTPSYLDLQNELDNTQVDLDLAELTILNLQLQVDDNTNDIVELDTRLIDLEYRVDKLESLIDGNSFTNIYKNTLGIPELVTIDMNDEDDVKIYIHLHYAITEGFSKQEVKQTLKTYLWEDLKNIIDKENVTIIVYADGDIDEEVLLSNLLN